MCLHDQQFKASMVHMIPCLKQTSRPKSVKGQDPKKGVGVGEALVCKKIPSLKNMGS